MTSSNSVHHDVNLERGKRQHWTLRQAFFLNAGGLCVESSSFHPLDQVTFTPYGVLELAKAGLLPNIDDHLLDDKSNADTFAKVIVCLQAGWFFAQCIGRWAQGLPISLLELHTLSNILCGAIMYTAWWYKPYDVQHALICDDERVRDAAAFFSATPSLMGFDDGSGGPRCTTNGIMDSARIRSAHRSPLRKGFSIRDALRAIYAELVSQYYQEGKSYTAEDSIIKGDARAKARFSKVAVNEEKVAEQLLRANRAIQRFRQHRVHVSFRVGECRILGPVATFMDPLIVSEAGNLLWSSSLRTTSVPSRASKFYDLKSIAFMVLSTLYGGLHLLAWDYHFPTALEMWMWRTSTVVLAATPLAVTFSFLSFALDDAMTQQKNAKEGKIVYMWQTLAICWRLIYFPVMLCLTVLPLCWPAARLYVLAEALASLRSCVAEIYATTSWAHFIPHAS